MNHDHSKHGPEPTNFWRTRYAIGLCVLGAIAACFLLTEHRAHLFGALPFLLLLACPLMHLFMHHDHGAEHDGAADHDDGKQRPIKPTTAQATTIRKQP